MYYVACGKYIYIYTYTLATSRARPTSWVRCVCLRYVALDSGSPNLVAPCVFIGHAPSLHCWSNPSIGRTGGHT